MSLTTDAPAAPTVAELRAAFRAVVAGRYRTDTAADPMVPDAADTADAVWSPAVGERTVVVLGAGGGCGATTVAVVLASAGAPARVVECSSAVRSGLVTAAFNELGAADESWLRGRRGPVILERRADVGVWVPAPLEAEMPEMLTVIDAGDIEQARRTGWLAPWLDEVPCVVATRATLPGLRQLETVLCRLDLSRAVAAVLGPALRRWPKALSYSLGENTRALLEDERLVCVPLDADLAITGLASAEISTPIGAAGAVLGDLVADLL